MEEAICRTSVAGIQNENLSLSQEKEGILNSNIVLISSGTSFVKNDSLKNTLTEIKEETNEEEKINDGMEINGNGYDSEAVINGEFSRMPEITAQKTTSPTLIESAFKVMKNLFSPDKTKSKSTTVLSPINQSLNGSPCSSLCIQSKADIFSSESEIEIQQKVQTPGEAIFKSHLVNNEVGIMQSPLTLDPLNNTDESFLTTVSLIDESFHSAVTNFDEHGEALKNGANLTENILNNSQNLGLLDPCNQTLENNESCLENTTLKVESFTSEENKLNSVSAQNQDENVEVLSTQVSSETLQQSDSTDIEYQCEELQKNSCNVLTPNKGIKSDVFETRNSPEVDNSQSTDSQKNLNTANENADNCESVEMSQIFLSRPLEQQMSENEIHVNYSNPNIFKESLNDIESENGNRQGILNDERDDWVEKCISTTTVILGTVDSADIDSMLMTLKTDDSETNTSSLTSFESDDVTGSLENVTGKMPITELDPSLVNKHVSDSNSFTSENLISLTDDKKTCVSEINSTNIKPDPNKFKLNKSDELINRKTSKEPTQKEKSAFDISLMKNCEASEISKEQHPHAKGATAQPVKVSNMTEIGKDEGDLSCHMADAIGVISQQSYTILAIHDSGLNRPVIEPLNISNSHFDKETFQISYQSHTTEIEKRSLNNSSNGSFGAEELLKSSQIKQSTPLWEGHNESNQKFFRPNSLRLSSPDVKEFVCEEKIGKRTKPNYLKSDKAKQIFSHGEQVEFSPVNPISDGELVFSNSVENEIKENSYDPLSTKILSSGLIEPKQNLGKQLGSNETKRSPDSVIRTLNQGFEKKPSPESGNVKQGAFKSPDPSAPQKLNQTFDKKLEISRRNQPDMPGHNSLNLTYDKRPFSPKKNVAKKLGSPEIERASPKLTKKMGSPEIERINQTFDKPESLKSSQLNKTHEKSVGNSQLNRSFEKKADSQDAQMLNRTYDKKPGSPLPCDLTHILEKPSEFSGRNQNNQTFSKGAEIACEERQVQGISKILKNVVVDDVIEAKEFSPAKESELKVETSQGNKTFEKRASMPDALNSYSSEDKIQSDSGFHFSESFDNNKIVLANSREMNDSFVSSKGSNTSLVGVDLSTVPFNEDEFGGNQTIDDLAGKLGKMDLKNASETQLDMSNRVLSDDSSVSRKSQEQNPRTEEKLWNSVKNDKSTYEPDLVQLIQQQFSSNDIEKICSVVHNLSSIKLNSDTLKASEQFDSSFSGNLPDSGIAPSKPGTKPPNVNALSPQSFDFLSSIQGKPTGRDLSRESLYVKFDPLVQPSANSLIDFTKEGEALPAIDASPVNLHSTSVCEQLLAISPQKKSDDIVPPLTPLSHKVKTSAKEDKIERLKELQNEIYFLKNLYAERERTNRIKMEDYENQIAKLTGESCMLEDKLKESNNREKSLVKKIKEQTQNIGQLKIIMEEYVKVIAKLTAELEVVKKENLKQTETLSLEKDSYMTHLQNTEAAFTDVHAKYEKSKKTIASLKVNETMLRNTIAEQTQRLEEFKVKAKEAQEEALTEFQKLQEVLNETKSSHSQEVARLRAQLRKTELKVEALQESLDQKIKENEQLTSICDELIEGKK